MRCVLNGCVIKFLLTYSIIKFALKSGRAKAPLPPVPTPMHS